GLPAGLLVLLARGEVLRGVEGLLGGGEELLRAARGAVLPRVLDRLARGGELGVGVLGAAPGSERREDDENDEQPHDFLCAHSRYAHSKYGDQAGVEKPPSSVTLRWFEPSKAMIHTCDLPSRVDVKTMLFPSGEKLASW